MKKILLYILIFIGLTGLSWVPSRINAQPATLPAPLGMCDLQDTRPPIHNTNNECDNLGGIWTADGISSSPNKNLYKLLAPINLNGEGITEFNPEQPDALGKYLNIMLKIIIGLSGVMAVVMIVLGGIEYMTSELVSSKESGKDRITGALLGLLITLSAYALLYTINPRLLSTEIKITETRISSNLQDLGGEASSTPFTPINNATLKARGIDCGGGSGKNFAVAVGQEFQGKATYSQTMRNTVNSSTIFLDCSSFVAQVYACANLPNPGGTTAAMFSSGNTQSVTGATYDFNQLNPGDLVGWKAGDNGTGKKVETDGHVMIYLGGGKVLHASSTSGGVTVGSLSDYQARITQVKWP